MKKRRPHRDPALALRILAVARARRSVDPLPLASRQALCIRHHGALTNITQGRGTWEDLNELANTLNVALKLAEAGAGSDEDRDAIQRAAAAVVAMEGRRAATGKVVAGPGELPSLQAALDIHDAQLEAHGMTEAMYLGAIDAVKAAIKRQSAGGAR